jgi:hypothetical protein
MATTSIQVPLDSDLALAFSNLVCVGGNWVMRRRFDLVTVLGLKFGFVDGQWVMRRKVWFGFGLEFGLYWWRVLNEEEVLIRFEFLFGFGCEFRLYWWRVVKYEDVFSDLVLVLVLNPVSVELEWMMRFCWFGFWFLDLVCVAEMWKLGGVGFRVLRHPGVSCLPNCKPCSCATERQCACGDGSSSAPAAIPCVHWICKLLNSARFWIPFAWSEIATSVYVDFVQCVNSSAETTEDLAGMHFWASKFW